jgi:hypothetical protein
MYYILKERGIIKRFAGFTEKMPAGRDPVPVQTAFFTVENTFKKGFVVKE